MTPPDETARAGGRSRGWWGRCAGRETPHDLEPHRTAFSRIDADDSELLLVADRAGQIVGTLRLSFLPGLSRRGTTRAQIEGVRVASSERGRALGEHLVHRAIVEAEQRGCLLVQLTSDKARPAAHRFYQRLGFQATHEGFKLNVGPPAGLADSPGLPDGNA